MKIAVLPLAAFILAFCEAFTSDGTVPLKRQETYTIGGIVNTTSGPVQGIASELRPNVSAYLGIPFAQPPVGDLRFALPVPVSASSAVIDATAFVSIYCILILFVYLTDITYAGPVRF